MVTILPEKKELACECCTVLPSTPFSHFTVKEPLQQKEFRKWKKGKRYPENDVFLVHIFGKKSYKNSNPIIDKEIINAAQQRRSVVLFRIKENNLVIAFLWQMCFWFNLRTEAGKKIARKNKLFERYKDMICQKIVPLATANKKNQKMLIQTIQQIFPDKIFSDSI